MLCLRNGKIIEMESRGVIPAGEGRDGYKKKVGWIIKQQ